MSTPYIEDDLRQLLANTPAISAIVPPAQVYPAYIKSDAVYPAISITTVGSTRTRSFENAVIIMKRIQVDCWGPTFVAVKNLETLLTNLLDGFTGYFVSGSFRVILCEASTVIDSWESNSSVYRVMIQFEISYS